MIALHGVTPDVSPRSHRKIPLQQKISRIGWSCVGLQKASIEPLSTEPKYSAPDLITFFCVMDTRAMITAINFMQETAAQSRILKSTTSMPPRTGRWVPVAYNMALPRMIRPLAMIADTASRGGGGAHLGQSTARGRDDGGDSSSSSNTTSA